MENAPESQKILPDDVTVLQEMVRSLTALHEEEKRHLETRIERLQEQIRLLFAKRFGRSSEQRDPNQLELALFDEAEVEAAKADREPEEAPVEVPGHRRGRPVRKPLPEALPRIEKIHDLPPEEKFCGVDGAALVEIGREISEQLDIVPAQVRVIRHVRLKYGCPHCQEGVALASLPPQPIPKSMASPGLLAQVATAKYADALPLYRQEGILRRIGVELPRSTLASWMVKCGALVQPLINLLQDRALSSGYVQMDETPVQVLNEPKRSATAKSFMWVWRTGDATAAPVILFDYDPSRGSKVPERLLTGFAGYLQTDGYAGYDAVGARTGVTGLGCMAHARRKFDEAVKAAGKQSKPGKAHQGLGFIQQLYQVERRAKEADMTPEQRHLLRLEHAAPVVEKLRTWLGESLPCVPPSSLLGKALGYLHDQWARLTRYLEDGRLEIDNNRVENSIRPFVVGRKGWLFSDTVLGAKASANLYSLIETAKANGHEPYHYLRHIFSKLPSCQSLEQFEALLPMSLPPMLSQPSIPLQDGVA